MATIRIDNTGDGICWVYSGDEWKDWVCDNFDENVVVMGNRDYTEITEASWYEEAKLLLDDIDECTTFDGLEEDFYKAYKDTYTREIIDKVYKVYVECNTYDNLEVITKVANILHPDIQIEIATIRGYSQGEWQEVAYIKETVDIDMLEAYYFGKISDITVETEDDTYGDIVTHDELWDMEHGNLKEKLREKYNIPEDEELTVMKCDGYVQVADWKEVI